VCGCVAMCVSVCALRDEMMYDFRPALFSDFIANMAHAEWIGICVHSCDVLW